MVDIPVPAHVKRMIEEEQQLASRMIALKDFMDHNPLYATLPDQKRTLMAIQHGCMTLYHNTLVQRIVLESY